MAQRTLHLIRHGQYHRADHPSDGLGGSLTELGKMQAQLAAQRLSKLPIRVIHHSTLRRAAETAAIIAALRPTVPLRPSRLLWECIPCVPYGYADEFAQTQAAEIEQGRRQAEHA